MTKGTNKRVVRRKVRQVTKDVTRDIGTRGGKRFIVQRYKGGASRRDFPKAEA